MGEGICGQAAHGTKVYEIGGPFRSGGWQDGFAQSAESICE